MTFGLASAELERSKAVNNVAKNLIVAVPRYGAPKVQGLGRSERSPAPRRRAGGRPSMDQGSLLNIHLV